MSLMTGVAGFVKTDIALDDINIFNNTSLPVSDFVSDRTGLCVGAPAQLTDLSQNLPTTWNWTFTPATVTYLNGTFINETLSQTVMIYDLTPFTQYELHVAACTNVGCVNSSALIFRTLQDG